MPVDVAACYVFFFLKVDIQRVQYIKLAVLVLFHCKSESDQSSSLCVPISSLPGSRHVQGRVPPVRRHPRPRAPHLQPLGTVRPTGVALWPRLGAHPVAQDRHVEGSLAAPDHLGAEESAQAPRRRRERRDGRFSQGRSPRRTNFS